MLKDWYKDRFLKYANANNNYKMNKYINKYILKGGGAYEDLITELDIPAHTKTYCADTSFTNHTGECWHDSLTMIFCYTDGIKEMVQKKLLNLTPKQIIDLARRTRLEFLAPCFRDDPHFFDNLEKYLTLLQNRFCAHTRIISDSGELSETLMCTKNGSKMDLGIFALKDGDKYSATNKRRRQSGVNGIQSSKLAQTIMRGVNIDGYESDGDVGAKYWGSYSGEIDEIILKLNYAGVEGEVEDEKDGEDEDGEEGEGEEEKKGDYEDEEEERHLTCDDIPLGENIFGTITWCNILSFCLLDDKKNIVLTLYGRFDISEENQSDMLAAPAIMIDAPKHAVALYRCNGVDIFYNDNYRNILNREYHADFNEEDNKTRITEKTIKLKVNREIIFNTFNENPNWNFYFSNKEFMLPIMYNHNLKQIQHTGDGGTRISNNINKKEFSKSNAFTTVTIEDNVNPGDPDKNHYLIFSFVLAKLIKNFDIDASASTLSKTYADNIILQLCAINKKIKVMKPRTVGMLLAKFINFNRNISYYMLQEALEYCIKINYSIVFDLFLDIYRPFTTFSMLLNIHKKLGFGPIIYCLKQMLNDNYSEKLTEDIDIIIDDDAAKGEDTSIYDEYIIFMSLSITELCNGDLKNINDFHLQKVFEWVNTFKINSEDI
jgi:hypothetical protein